VRPVKALVPPIPARLIVVVKSVKAPVLVKVRVLPPNETPST
jgi:hypothetical protein